jgi:hypothetical protein
MSWQVDYALKNIRQDQDVVSAEHIGGDGIRVAIREHPDVVAVIYGGYKIDRELAQQYFRERPDMDFLCGYRKECVWEGGAIKYLEEQNIGWGSAGTLSSALGRSNVRAADHKEYRFAYRLIKQLRSITELDREFDRVFSLKLGNGRPLRIGMVKEYEPTADSIRTLWQHFGKVDIAWCINPNSFPRRDAIEAGRELGCEVLQWEDLKIILKGR